MRFPRCSLALGVVLLAGCGSGSPAPAGTTAQRPVASAPDAKAPPPDATAPATDPGAGDERSIRVPAAFALRDGALVPPTITVPPFLAVELSVRADGTPHRVVLRTPRPHALDVPASGNAAVRIAGLHAGRYAIALDGRRAGTLVVGGQVGP